MTGQLTSRMTSDASSVTAPVQQILNSLLSNLILLCGAFCMCFYTSWTLTMLALTMIGPVIYITGIYAQWSKDINLTIRASMGDANACATESLKNIRTVRSFGADRVELQAYQSYLDTAWLNMRKDAFASAGVSAISGYVNFAAGILVYWYGGNSVLSSDEPGHLTIGNLITFNMYWNMLNTSIQAVNSMLNTLVVAASSAKRVFEVMDLEPDIQMDDTSAVPLDREVPLGRVPEITFENVHFTYQMRPDKKVFEGLSFTIPAGSTIAFVGRSGCGKSTTMGLLMRFYDPQQGRILLAGRPLADWNLRSYQRRIGVVSQETQIFARSVRENLTYGMEPEDYADELDPSTGAVLRSPIEEAAKSANAHEFIMQMDRGYDSMLGEGGSRLSGGQKQRLSIARAFLRRPQLLLLDEATSALDTENERQIQGAIDDMVRAMAGSCSIVIIAHRLSTVRDANKIVVINDGEAVEQGTHDELMKEDAIYASLVKRQMSKAEETCECSESVEDTISIGGVKKGKGKGKLKGKVKGHRAGETEVSLAEEGSAAPLRAGKGGGGATHATEVSEGKGQQRQGQGKGKGGGWAKLESLTPEERNEWLRNKMKTVLQRALKGFGNSEVAEALILCMHDAIESGPKHEDTTDVEGSEPPHDAIKDLFREVMLRSGLSQQTPT